LAFSRFLAILMQMDPRLNHSIILKDRRFDLFIEERTIAERVRELAQSLEGDYRHKDPYFVVVLNGAFIFAADMLRHMALNPKVGFIHLASYRGLQSTGYVRRLLRSLEDIRDRHVVIVEDIVDTGLTISRLTELLGADRPASIEVATLLHKKIDNAKKLEIKYVGFTIPDKFVVGYGMDYEGYGRNLSDLFQLA
jgi:hypoxanthine phosphoribosyltransferase